MSTVIVVEPSLDLRLLIRMALVEDFEVVTEVFTLDDAVAAAHQRFDVAVIDLNVSVADVVAISGRLRPWVDWIVGLAPLAPRHEVSELAGVDRLLIKPFSVDELQRAVRDRLSRGDG